MVSLLFYKFYSAGQKPFNFNIWAKRTVALLLNLRLRTINHYVNAIAMPHDSQWLLPSEAGLSSFDSMQVWERTRISVHLVQCSYRRAELPSVFRLPVIGSCCLLFLLLPNGANQRQHLRVRQPFAFMVAPTLSGAITTRADVQHRA